MIPIKFSHQAAGNPESQFRIATWAQAAPKHNLATVEVMPSTNEQACVRMVRLLGWEGDHG